MADAPVISGGGVFDMPEYEPLNGGDVFHHGDPTDQARDAKTPAVYPSTGGPDHDTADDDWPEYDPPIYEPQFYTYMQYLLASKIALRMSGNAQLSQMMLQEAAVWETAAMQNTTNNDRSAQKDRNQTWWTDGCIV
jgi:hypothetical protein